MRKLCSMIVLMCLSICGCGNASKLKIYEQALADTNKALTEAQDRAVARQAQAERLGRLYVKARGPAHHKKKATKK